jgi:hypothetical protein
MRIDRANAGMNNPQRPPAENHGTPEQWRYAGRRMRAPLARQDGWQQIVLFPEQEAAAAG